VTRLPAVPEPTLEEAALAALRIERTSTAERLADRLRELMVQGVLKPGSPLREQPMVDALGVSRNSIREAFRLLAREGLVTHEMHKGVVVKRLDAGDIRDIYRTRALLEPLAVKQPTNPVVLAQLAVCVAEAERAHADDDWETVGTCDLRFHRLIVSLLGAQRISNAFEAVLVELRLAFAEVEDPDGFYGPFVPRNRRLLQLLEAGEREDCAVELLAYLREAEARLLQVFAAAADGSAS
jgi:DNA-binding GntR family transcriptional regulator